VEQQIYANNLVQYMKASINEDTSDDKSETEDDPLQKMCSIFYDPSLPVESKSQTRRLKSGKSGYQKPVKSGNISSNKLVPQVLPRQTKNDRKKSQLAALGPNNNIMANFLAQKQPSKVETSNMLIDPALNHANFLDSEVSDQGSQRLNNIQAHSLAAPPQNPKSINETAQSKADKGKAQWDELHLALVAATSVLKEKGKNKDFIFPQSIVDNLNELNNLRHQYLLDGTPLPTSAASCATAHSSIRQQTTKGPPTEVCGIYLAKLICKQAWHFVTYQEIPLNNVGNKKNH
jgi:hypothetical protein